MVVDTSSVPRVEVLKAIAEPIRWQIVERLAVEDLCVCHLVEDLGVTQPLVSHHLKVLREAGIVEAERFKQWVYYRLVTGALDGLARDLAGFSKKSRAAPRRRPCG